MKIIAYRKGMTLIEIIVSIAFLSIIAITLFAVYETNVFMSIHAGDKTKNVSSAAGIAENSLAGSVITSNPVTNIVTVSGVAITDAKYIEDNTINLEVTYNGSAVKRNVNMTKIDISKEQKTVRNGTIQTEIEVYKP